MTSIEVGSVSPDDRVGMIAWLRGLPERVVLLDGKQRAWQVGHTSVGTCLMRVNFDSVWLCRDDSDMDDAVRGRGPFRVLWIPPWATWRRP